MRRLVLLSVVVVLISAAAFAGLLVTPTAQNKQQPSVAVTIGLLGELASRLTESQVEVYQILPPGVELHDWEPTPDVVEKAGKARVLVWLLEDLDGWGDRVARNARVESYKAGTGLELIALDHHAFDVHVWLNPRNMARIVENIAAMLSEKFPDLRPVIQRNSAALLDELNQLDREFSSKLSAYRGKTIITQHDAFRYLADAYGLKVLAVLGGHEEEPSAAHIKEIYEVIKTENIKVIFAEDDFVNPILATISRDTGVEVRMLYTGEGLNHDDYKKGKGYVNILRSNLEALLNAFER
ncbi:MAG: zinc ABC transporter substrate-binding protein [Candidatus Caldarchaeum sp.]|uniref:Zinc ABC transporter substrate-binding protein n=1 Tax=Caldiarchaeum subterraneum TaxID=311458 RepID=A0A7J3VRH0_CALS0